MSAPGYTYLTLGAARTQLAARLEDPTFVYWTVSELNDIINESVRTWQALTGTFKQRAQFDIVLQPAGSNAFFDLRSILSGVLSFYVTDLAIVNIVLAALLEPPLSQTWTGTGQFQFSQIVNALQLRINRWLGDTGANVTRNIQFMGPNTSGPSVSRTFLPEAVMDVRRASWLSTSNLYTTLWRDDELAMQAFATSRALAPTDPPLVWGKFTIPPVGIEVYPPPSDPGQLETLVVTSGPQIGTTPAAIYNTPTVLDIPEDFVWGMTFGALSELLSADGPMRDLDRAQYAESRYQESVELYRLNPTLIATQIDGVPIWSGSVFELDAFMASWQSQTGPPQFCGMAGRNLVAFGPQPDGTYSVTMDLLCNIPVPVADTDFIQVNRGALNPLLDYAEHRACFKMAGTEFHNTDKLRAQFYVNAALENSRITAGNFYRSALELPAQRQQQEVPRIGASAGLRTAR